MPFYKRDKIYWVQFRSPSGEKIRQSTGTPDKKLAQEYHDRLKLEYWKIDKFGDKPRRSWAEAGERWLQESADKKSLHSDVFILRWLFPYLSPLKLDEISLEVIDRIKDAKLKEDVSKSRVNRYLALIKSILRRARDEWRWIDYIPKIRLYTEPKGRVRWITKEEYLRLLQELPKHQAAMVQFALVTGLRQSNVLELEWNQVNLEKGIAWVRAENAKAGKAIGVPLNDDAIRILRDQIGEHPTRVFTFRGSPIKWANTMAWRAALKRAEIKNFRWHDLRHTWASWHVQNGTPISALKELGGWGTMDMVQRYAHMGVEHLAKFTQNVEL